MGILRFGPGENGRLFGKGGAHSIKYGTSTLGNLTNPKKCMFDNPSFYERGGGGDGGGL